MELIGLVLIAVVVCWKVGIIKSVKETVDMANNEVAVQSATHKSSVVKRAAELDSLDKETLAKAKENIAALKDFQL